METEFFSSNIKKFLHFPKGKLFLYFLIFSQKKAFLLFSQMKSCTFQPQPALERFLHFLYFQKLNPAFFSSTPKNENISPEKISYASGNENPENVFIFQETETLKTSYISESNFQSWKSKRFLIFRQMELSCHKLRKLFIFQEGTFKSQKQTKNLLRRNFQSPVTFL